MSFFSSIGRNQPPTFTTPTLPMTGPAAPPQMPVMPVASPPAPMPELPLIQPPTVRRPEPSLESLMRRRAQLQAELSKVNDMIERMRAQQTEGTGSALPAGIETLLASLTRPSPIMRSEPTGGFDD